MTTIHRTSSVQISRAEQRKQRLRELETEQAAEEAEALKMTEEQRLTLLKSFTSVKVEFTDLDGLRWSQTALHKFPTNVAHLSPTSHATSKDNTFVVLTNADLANFSAEDTIRVSASTTRLRPRHPGYQVTLPHITSESHRRHRNGSRSRSPIKGLFQPGSSHKGSDTFTHSIDTPYFEPSDGLEGNVIPVTDNGFVTKYTHGVVSRGRISFVGPPGLSPVGFSEHQILSSASVPNLSDSLKGHIGQISSITDTHDFLSIPTVFPPKDTLYQPLAPPASSKSPLMVHSFVTESPCQIYSPQQSPVRLPSIPHRPIPCPVELDTTPSPFLLSSANFGNIKGQDPVIGIVGNVIEDDETPTTSPIKMAGANLLKD